MIPMRFMKRMRGSSSPHREYFCNGARCVLAIGTGTLGSLEEFGAEPGIRDHHLLRLLPPTTRRRDEVGTRLGRRPRRLLEPIPSGSIMNQENPWPSAASAVDGSAATARSPRNVFRIVPTPVDRETITRLVRTTSPAPRGGLRGRARRARAETPADQTRRTGRRGRPPRSARGTSACTGRRTPW